MDLFRRKQKLIYWIVALIIIPSFVLVWGVDRYGTGNPYADFNAGEVDGEALTYQDFDAFQKRIAAATGGLPLQIANLPGAGTRAEELNKYLAAYALLQDAIKAGATASDLQVGTYLEHSHPMISPRIDPKDPSSKEKAVDVFCRSHQISRAELLQGIREWQTIGNYIDNDNRLATVNEETAFAFYSLNKAEVVTKVIHFTENDAVREAAKTEIMAKPAEELEREARNYAAGKSRDPRYRTPAKWRFAWILTPFVEASSVPQPSDADIEAEYARGGSVIYDNQTLDQVRDRIKAELVEREVERLTARNLTVDVDEQLRNHRELSPEELVKLTPLAKYGVIAGDTGPELLSAEEVVKAMPEGASRELTGALMSVDASPERDGIILNLRDGFNLYDRPYQSDKGLFRLHLLEYVPSEAAALDGPDGKMNPELYEIALSDMVGDRTAEMIREEAEKVHAEVDAYMAAKEKGEDVPDAEFAAMFESLPVDTVPYLQIGGANYQLGSLPIGGALGPRTFTDPQSGERGQELVVVIGRRIPTREAYESEPDDMKERYRQIALSNFRGGYGVTNTARGPEAIINPGPAIMGSLYDKFLKGGIRPNQELLRGEG